MVQLFTALRKSPGPIYGLVLGLVLAIAGRLLGADGNAFYLGVAVGGLVVFAAFFIDLFIRSKPKRVDGTPSRRQFPFTG
jgi:uncharacterized membrane protein (UPF0136 family)